MLVRSAVTGVRSSCEASATSWRWAAIEPSSVSSIALKRAASSPTSSWLVTSIRRPRSSVSLDVARRLGHAHDRRDEVARRKPAERGRERDAADDERQQHPAQPGEDVVGRLQRARELERAAALERDGQHSHVLAVELRVAEARASGGHELDVVGPAAHARRQRREARRRAFEPAPEPSQAELGALHELRLGR